MTRSDRIEAAAKAAQAWITELTEATDGRALDMIEREHRREELLTQLRDALGVGR